MHDRNFKWATICLCFAGYAAVASAAAAPLDSLPLVAPELRAPLEGMLAAGPMPELNAQNLAERRTRRWAETSGPAVAPAWERRLVSRPKGTPEVPVYLINAQPVGANKPAILHIHGGGYILGNAKDFIPSLQAVARELDCVIVSVDYRLAPETVFPGALEDNYAALRWLHDSAHELGVDPGRIAVMGESAGGGHAAMLAIAARDRHEVPLVAQVLIYPMLDDRTGSARAVPAHIGQFVWTRAANRFGWTSLLGQPAGAAKVPPGSVPARQTRLAGLPPAFIGVGALDLFVQEDMVYAQRLVEAGVATDLDVVAGAYHGFDLFAPQAQSAQRFREAWQGMLRRAFATAK